MTRTPLQLPRSSDASAAAVPAAAVDVTRRGAVLAAPPGILESATTTRKVEGLAAAALGPVGASVTRKESARPSGSTTSAGEPERPPAPPQTESSVSQPRPPGAGEPLPPGWSKHWSKSFKKEYWFHEKSGKQTWEAPQGIEPEPLSGDAASSSALEDGPESDSSASCAGAAVARLERCASLTPAAFPRPFCTAPSAALKLHGA